MIALMITLVLVTTLTAVNALPVTIDEVEIDGSQVLPDTYNNLDVERGQEVDVRIEFTAHEDLDNVELMVFLSGYEFNDREGQTISDVLGPFDFTADTTYVRTAKVNLPMDLDVDEYKLRLVMADRTGDELVERYNLQIDTPKHALQLTDVLLVPGDTLRAGEALIAKVRLENKGQREEEDVRVTLDIPELGLRVQGFINEISDGDEQEESEDLLLRVPVCTEPGTYDLNVKVDYNRRKDTITETHKVTILESELCNKDTTPKTQITIGNDFQSVEQGKSSIFSLSVQNTGKSSTSYSVAVSTPDGLTHSISPTSATVLGAGQSQTFYIFVEAAEDAQLGPKVVTATVKSGAQKLQDVALTADVKEGDSSLDVRRVLEIGLITLVVLLVVVGLIVGLTRLRGDDDKESTTYY